MDAFEELVAEVLRADGYWMHQGYKIYLSREEKQALGKRRQSRRSRLKLEPSKPALC